MFVRFEHKRFNHKMTVLSMVIAVSLAHCQSSAAQDISFAAAVQPQLDNVEVNVQVTGVIKVRSSRVGIVVQPVAVSGQLQYEQWLSPPQNTELIRSIRYYRKVATQMKIAQNTIVGSLRNDRRLVIDQLQRDDHRLYCPQGPLTRDELDMLNVQLSPTTLRRLLPTDPLAVGATWKLTFATLAPILVIDAISKHTVIGTLLSVKDDLAQLHFQGKVEGAIDGVGTAIDLQITVEYDLRRQRFLQAKLSMSEKREIGDVQPGLDVTATIDLQLEPVTELSVVTPAVVENWNRSLPVGAERILVRPNAASVDLLIERNWHVMVDQRELFMMRCVEQGELIAQCSVVHLPLPTGGETMTLTRFQQQIRTSLGEQFNQFAEATQLKHESGGRLFRIVVVGQANEIPFQWIYYHITGPRGNQSAVVFTISNERIEQFADQDRQLVKTMQFTENKTIQTAVTDASKR